MSKLLFSQIISKIKARYGSEGNIPLHAPVFAGNEKKYLNDCIDSTFVSSVGKFVDEFERQVATYTGARFGVATTNGTAALQLALRCAGAGANTEVITQSLSFVATANAILYNQAQPVFLDVERQTWGLSPDAVANFLDSVAEQRDGGCYNRNTGRRIAAIVPMHTFGAICQIERLSEVAAHWGIPLVEDAAESVGSSRQGKHAGTYGLLSALSFNGNKIITTGGGGMILTNDEEIARRAKFLSTTAKSQHQWAFHHPEMGHNFRLPNLNAALGVAQLEQLETFLVSKRQTAQLYAELFDALGLQFLRFDSHSNCWLNTVLMENIEQRDAFLQECHSNGVLARPAWDLLHSLPYLRTFQHDALTNAIYLAERAVSLPSSFV